jgi:hypothetical protein
MTKRSLWIIGVLSLVFGSIPAQAAAQSDDTVPSGTTHPAVVTLSAGTAELRGSGNERRLMLEDVAPTLATFDSDEFDEIPVNTWSAIDLLQTRPSVVAIVQPVDPDSDAETERLRLSKLRYDAPSGDLTAVARPVGAGKVPELLQDAGGAADGDGALPEGPVKMFVFDDDTEVTDGGAPIPTDDMLAPGDYQIELNLHEDKLSQNWTVRGTADPYCINASDFSTLVTAIGPLKDLPLKALLTTFTVDQSWHCIVRVARLVYKISVNGQDATELVYQQVGPRSFVTTCSNIGSFTAGCGNDWWQVSLTLSPS